MQMNRTGIGLIAFFGLAGLAMCRRPDPARRQAGASPILASIGAIWVLVAARPRSGTPARQKRKAAHQDWVFRNGMQRHRDRPRRVGSHADRQRDAADEADGSTSTSPASAAARSSRREMMPVFTATRMEPGLVLPVYVNPEDPDDFVLVW